MKRILGLILVLCLGCMAAAAEEINWRALEGGELMVYVSCDPDHGEAVVNAFREKTGINADFFRLSANDCYLRLRNEHENPQADVWYGGTWDPYISAARDGLLYAYEDFEHVPYKSPNYGIGEPYWFGIYSGYIGFICDMDALKKAGVAAPTSWDDLMKPEYEGMLCLANPNVTGTGVMTASILFQRYGEERAVEMFSEMDQNVAVYANMGLDVGEKVATGEAAIGVGFLHTGLMYINAGYDNLRLFAPSDGTGYEVGGTAIIEGAKHLDEAKLFLAFAMSPECQEIGQTIGAMQFLTVQGAQDPEAAQMLVDMGINLIDYNSVWTGENKDHIIEAWNSVITPEKIDS